MHTKQAPKHDGQHCQAESDTGQVEGQDGYGLEKEEAGTDDYLEFRG